MQNVQNLAVDWLNFKLYVLEATMERIDMCSFDGGNRVTLVAENLQSPHGLALDPTVGWVEIFPSTSDIVMFVLDLYVWY